MREVKVDLPQNGYVITIGQNLCDAIVSHIANGPYSSRALLITDTNVGALYGDAVQSLLTRAGLLVSVGRIPAGESSKSLAQAEMLYTRAIEAGLDRKSLIVALGGGVVGDLAGFIAATYMRGVPFLQLPTSLLAQVDSSVGGKVAVNHVLGKNLIGAFYQPKRVFIDLDYLQTLPARELYTGLGEIVKYGVIYDSVLFAYLEEHATEILAKNTEALAHIIHRSCEIKAAVVTEDEQEQGLRRILNFGHTLGHAIEKETNYARYNHGEAVAIGMMGAAYISEALQLTDAASVSRLQVLLENLHLPTQAEGCDPKAVYEDLFHDKKTVDGKVTWVLMQGIGKVVASDAVPEEIVKQTVARILR